MYVVWYRPAFPTKYATAPALAGAEKARRKIKNQGWCAWIEKLDGTFVPVKGAMRSPRKAVSDLEQKRRLSAALKGK